MKKIIAFTFTALYVISSLAQTQERNLEKYWRYRERFKNNFIVIGDCCGCGFPARQRGHHHCDGNSHLNFGDTEIMSGRYLGMLATEYHLLKQDNQDVSGTVEEMYYALEAINRVDRYGEAAWAAFLNKVDYDPCTGTEQLNGFFIRDDQPWNMHNLNYNDVPIGVLLNSGNYTIVDPINWVDSNFGQPNYNTTAEWGPTEMSKDQVYGLLMGFRLITHFVDESEQFNGVGIVQETRNITRRIMNWIFAGEGIIYNPMRFECVWGPGHCRRSSSANKCECGGAVTHPDLWGAFNAASLIINDPGWTSVQLDNHLPIITASKLLWDRYQLIAPTDRLILELSALFPDGWGLGTAFRLAQKTAATNHEHLPLFYSLLHGTPSLIPNNRYECMLNSAPCEGPHPLQVPGYIGCSQWSSNDRLERPEARAVDDKGCEVEFSGLDYMLLYNLYHISRGGALIPGDYASPLHLTLADKIETSNTSYTACRVSVLDGYEVHNGATVTVTYGEEINMEVTEQDIEIDGEFETILDASACAPIPCNQAENICVGFTSNIPDIFYEGDAEVLTWSGDFISYDLKIYSNEGIRMQHYTNEDFDLSTSVIVVWDGSCWKCGEDQKEDFEYILEVETGCGTDRYYGSFEYVNNNNKTSRTYSDSLRTTPDPYDDPANWNGNQFLPDEKNNKEQITASQFSNDLFHYPNPLTNITTIEYSLMRSSAVTLIVTDMVGRTVEVLIQEQSQEAGIHTLDFDASRLAPGIYFYTIKAIPESGMPYTATKKMVKVM